jgi:hypothetical protein
MGQPGQQLLTAKVWRVMTLSHIKFGPGEVKRTL